MESSKKAMDAPIRVLHVGGDSASSVAGFNGSAEDIAVTTAPSAADGLALLAESPVDCIVSAYRLPETDGLAFLETVRESRPDLPFVLFPAEGSESLASEAIAAGATDYLPKGDSADQYARLADRIRTAVEAERGRAATRRRFERLLEHAADYVIVIDAAGTVEYASPSVERVLGYEPAELEGDPIVDVVHPEDRETARSDLGAITDDPDAVVTSEIRAVTADGSQRWLETKARNLLDDPAVEGIVGNVRDITERKEQAATVDWHRTVIESMAAGVYVFDEDLQFRFVSFQADDPGLSATDLVGRDLSVLREQGVVPDRRAADLRAALEAVLAGDREEVRMEFRPDVADSADTLELRLTPIRGTGPERGPMVLGTARDVSDRRERERRITALHDATRGFVASETPAEVAERAVYTAREVLDLELSAFYRYDESADALVPEAWTDQAGTLVAEPPTYTGGESLVWEVFRSGLSRYFQDVTAHPNCYDPETALRTEFMIPLSDHGVLLLAATEVDAFDEATRTVARTLAANAEVALELVERTISLADSERRYETLVENFPDGAVFLYDEDHRYTLAGGTEIESVGLDAEEMVGKRMQEVLPERVVEKQEPMYSAALAGEPQVFEETYEGEQYRVQTLPIEDEDGTVRRGMLVAENVTERREHERRLQRQNERLEQFASVVSHDIRNPLRVATGNLELAAERCDSDRIGTALSALERIDDIIDRTLSLARSGRSIGETEPVDLSVAVSEWGQAVETDEVTLETERPPTVRADRDRLRQLFENLVRNAVEQDAETVRIGGLEDGFYVADDGPGIPPDERSEVFDAGYSTDDDGTGLGLVIVEDVATAHGWEIDVTESEAGGARFEITDAETV